jgi:hypothetical protein
MTALVCECSEVMKATCDIDSSLVGPVTLIVIAELFAIGAYLFQRVWKP